MRWLTTFVLLIGFAVPALAHHPDRQHHRVVPYFDLIGPIGSRMPPSYRRKYNRPTNLGGRIAYWIAPSSQEAMAWHDATHRRAYKDHRPRIEKHYFFPKPWEALRIGARRPSDPETAQDGPGYEFDPAFQQEATEAAELVPSLLEPIADEAGLIEDLPVPSAEVAPAE